MKLLFSVLQNMMNTYSILSRLGADYFESLLIDHDVCSNYGNWNSAAGLTGCSAAGFSSTSKCFYPKLHTRVFSCD